MQYTTFSNSKIGCYQLIPLFRTCKLCVIKN